MSDNDGDSSSDYDTDEDNYDGDGNKRSEQCNGCNNCISPEEAYKVDDAADNNNELYCDDCWKKICQRCGRDYRGYYKYSTRYLAKCIQCEAMIGDGCDCRGYTFPLGHGKGNKICICTECMDEWKGTCSKCYFDIDWDDLKKNIDLDQLDIGPYGTVNSLGELDLRCEGCVENRTISIVFNNTLLCNDLANLACDYVFGENVE